MLVFSLLKLINRIEEFLAFSALSTFYSALFIEKGELLEQLSRSSGCIYLTQHIIFAMRSITHYLFFCINIVKNLPVHYLDIKF